MEKKEQEGGRKEKRWSERHEREYIVLQKYRGRMGEDRTGE